MVSIFFDMNLSNFVNISNFRTNQKSIASIRQVYIHNCIDQETSIRESRKNIGSTPNESLSKNNHPPLLEALKSSAEKNVASFHFPGHNRGRAAPDSMSHVIGIKPFIHDLPELPELDNLFCPEGPILEAQKLASELFRASETWFLVGGTTCGIQAAILATCSPGSTLVLPRNSHISAFSALVLSGALPKYVIPEYHSDWDIPGGITVSQVKRAIRELEMEGKRPAAVFVTSPTYHGICSNLSEISSYCHSVNIPLIVDEAHGAHLGFHKKLPKSALSQGADISVQSTHKVLCSLTQSSMLHISKSSLVSSDKITKCLQILQSTSPSYLLLASLDAARAQLSETPETIFNSSVELSLEAKLLVNEIRGISTLDLPNIDPLRLTVGVWNLGISGYEADEILDKDYNIISELSGTKSITFAINLGTCREHVHRLVLGLKYLSNAYLGKKIVGEGHFGPIEKNTINMCLSPREAFFANKRKVNVWESVGEICGELICPYPPGIPVLIPGEYITTSALDYLLKIKSAGGIISGASDPLLSSIVICDR